MIDKFIDKYSSTFYVQIWERKIKVTDIASKKVFEDKPLIAISNNNGSKQVEAFGNSATLIKGKNIEVINPFSHERSLLSNFEIGEKLLQIIFKKLSPNRIFVIRPNAVMHPMEKLEGGLTEIEVNALKDLAQGAGARNVTVYQGSELSITDFNYKTLNK